jgi:TPR repeat protein
MKFECPGCGQRLEADEGFAGAFFRCPSCEREVQAPCAPIVPVLSPEELVEEGKRIQSGDGITPDKGKAFSIFLEAANRGNAEAQYLVGECYRDGSAVEKSEQSALEWFHKAATANFVKAFLRLGLIYQSRKDDEEAIQWFSKAADAGNRGGGSMLAMIYKERGETEKEFEWLKRAALLGDQDALWEIRLHYETAREGTVEMAEAHAWLSIFEDGFTRTRDSTYLAAYMIFPNLDSYKTTADQLAELMSDEELEEAKRRYEELVKTRVEQAKRCAEAGSDEWQFMLGWCFYDGYGVDADASEAVKWWRLAAEKGCRPAQRFLAELNKSDDEELSPLPASQPVTDTPVGKHESAALNYQWQARLASIGKVAGGILLSIVCLAVILLILIFGGKFATQVDPWTQALAGLSLLLVVPLSLILLIFRRTRGYGGLGIYLASWPVGLSLWISCVAYAVAVSVTWTIVGIMMGGLGIVPIAAIMTLFRRDWWGFGTIIGMIVITWGLRATGLWIASKSEDDSLELSNRAGSKKSGPFAAVLRWIAVLPFAVLSYAAVNAVMILYVYLVNAVEVHAQSHNHFAQYSNTLLAPIAFVYAGTMVAPARRSATAIVLTVLHTIICAGVYGFVFHAMLSGYHIHGGRKTTVELLISVVVAVICCVRIIYRDKDRLISEEQADAAS